MEGDGVSKRNLFGIATRRAPDNVAKNFNRQLLRGYAYIKRTNLGRRKGDKA